MTIQRIRKLGDPILRQESSQILFPLSATDKQLIQDMLHTLHDFQERMGFGRGIAAPQIGSLKRAICIDMGQPKFFINPVISSYGGEKQRLFDDCFSMPEIMVHIERSLKIEVTYQTIEGETRVETFTGDWAELLQHEIDHLYGMMAIDRVSSVRDVWARQEWLRRKGLK